MAVIEPATYDPVTSGAYRKNPDGSVSTVKTATSEVDGSYMNYPTIQKSPSGNWVELPPAVALSNVLKSGQHLGVYDDEQEALDAAEQLHQSEAARLGMKAGFNAAMKAAKNVSDTFGVPVRPTYESEDDFFKGRPDVAGMATEDGSIITNRYSTISPKGMSKLPRLEGFRQRMKQYRNENPDYRGPALTEEQQYYFENYSPYEGDRLDTILSRALVGDKYIPALTDEQAQELARLEALFGSTPYNSEKAVGKEPPAGWNAEHAPEFNRRFDELIRLVDSQK